MKLYDWIEQNKNLTATMFKELSTEEKELRLSKAFEEAMDKINKVYVAGTLDFMATTEKRLFRKYLDTDNALNHIWSGCLEGNKPFSLFLDLVEQYQAVIIEGTGQYSKHLARKLQPERR